MAILGYQSLELAGIRAVLQDDSRVRIVGEGTWNQAPNIVRSTRPDVLVASHNDPEEALSALRTYRVSVPARIVLVSRLTEHATRMLLRLGVRGVLLRDDCVEHLLWAVRATAAGSLALTPAAAGFVVDQYVRPGQLSEEVTSARKLLTSLSPREREILELIANGASNPVVAETLSISGHTVKDHIRAIYTKLSANNRIQAALILWQARSRPGPKPPEHARGTSEHTECSGSVPEVRRHFTLAEPATAAQRGVSVPEPG
ncbi:MULTISPECIES: LuxR C-terminal-related transcriptional regulator [unclassified Streptomyces]|uniref:LuxR C-terminal-related transcriptional regulator n=1 Tax=unclassified Streptomyces TaxID=2593676 RepID=UPI0011803F4A|nr:MULTISPECIES: response regulator transcription factor [unclassified Streptomyces]